MLTNPDAAWRTYDGVQVVATRRFFERWSLQGSYAWSRTIGSFDNENGSNAANTDLGRGGHFTNPNRAINSVGRTVFDRPHDIRAFGTYAFPYWGGLRVSGVYRLTSGTPWARLQSADARTQVFQAGIRVEPIGMRTLPVSHEADLRVEKTVTLQNRTVAGLYVDIYNVTNRSVATRVVEFSGPSFGNPLRFSPARRFRIGGRISF